MDTEIPLLKFIAAIPTVSPVTRVDKLNVPSSEVKIDASISVSPASWSTCIDKSAVSPQSLLERVTFTVGEKLWALTERVKSAEIKKENDLFENRVINLFIYIFLINCI